MRFYALALMAALEANPCYAEELSVGAFPEFDVEQRCANRPDAVETGLCLKQERASYDALKTVWDTLSAKIRVRCTEIAQHNRYLAYSVMLQCAVRGR